MVMRESGREEKGVEFWETQWGLEPFGLQPHRRGTVVALS